MTLNLRLKFEQENFVDLAIHASSTSIPILSYSSSFYRHYGNLAAVRNFERVWESFTKISARIGGKSLPVERESAVILVYQEISEEFADSLQTDQVFGFWSINPLLSGAFV